MFASLKMDLPPRTVLVTLAARAVALAAVHTAPSVATARYLSSVSVSLITLSRNTRDHHMMQDAKDLVQRLTEVVRLLPATERISEEFGVDILRIANSSANNNLHMGDEVLQACVLNLLTELDGRLTEAQIILWRPQTIVSSLHALAKVASAEMFVMVNTLLFCAKERLLELDERRVVRLLWCIVRLRMEREHAILWKSTCRRLLHLFDRLTRADRSLLVETLIPITECVCDTQHELVCMLLNSRTSRAQSDTLDGEEEVMRGDYQALKSHLLSEVHVLPVESIVALLSRMCGTSSSLSVVDCESVDYLLQHLSFRRQLKMDVCRKLLELIAILEPSELSQSLRQHIVNCICGENHASFVKEDSLSALETVCIATALELQQTHSVCAATRGQLVLLISICHEMRDVVRGRYGGRLAGTLAVALDLLTSCGAVLEEDAMLVKCCQLLEQFPIAWEQSGIASAMVVEYAACICSICELLRLRPLFVTLSSLSGAANGGSDIQHKFSSGCVAALLHRCTDVFGRVSTFLPTGLVFDMWRKSAEVMAGGNRSILQPLVELLLDYAERHPTYFSLREMTQFMGTGRDYFPAEAFGLFLDCLRCNGKNIMPFHLEVLVTSLETVAMRGDKELLERLQLMLFLRPLGHDAAPVHSFSFSTPQLVRLFRCCSISSDVMASMQATVIELIVNSCVHCTTMEELNAAASLLPQLQHSPLKDPLAWAVTERGKSLHLGNTPDVQKALLVVYIHKSGLKVEESLLAALRQRPK